MTLGSFQVQAFLATKDAAAALPFYGDVLGLRLVGDEPTALVFDAAGTQLRIQKVKEQDELGIWTTPGAKVAWFKDPDGNLLSLAQLG